jgi:hypothetical protein
MVRLRLVGLGIMYSDNRAEDGGADHWRRGVGGRGLYYFVYLILWRKAYDVLCKNVENDGLCVFRWLVLVT